MVFSFLSVRIIGSMIVELVTALTSILLCNTRNSFIIQITKNQVDHMIQEKL